MTKNASFYQVDPSGDREMGKFSARNGRVDIFCQFVYKLLGPDFALGITWGQLKLAISALSGIQNNPGLLVFHRQLKARKVRIRNCQDVKNHRCAETAWKKSMPLTVPGRATWWVKWAQPKAPGRCAFCLEVGGVHFSICYSIWRPSGKLT